mmetsp:Transcript_36834/g.85615  ORF Transcript_36834/g.85615 Transcript_36834/m.85615 type:complete len:590 (+) Transcript_36834:586-2355(+)
MAQAVRLVDVRQGPPPRQVGRRARHLPEDVCAAVHPLRQARGRHLRLHLGEARGTVHRPPRVRPAGGLRRLVPHRPARLCPHRRRRPCRRPPPFRRRHGLRLQAAVHLPRPGPGPHRRTPHRRRHRARQLGPAAELPSCGELDAAAGEAGGEPGRGQGPPRLPPLAHLDALQQVPRHHPPRRHQDDQRAPQGPQDQPRPLLPQVRRRHAPELLQARALAQARLRPLLPPRHCSGPPTLRPSWVEHPVRICAGRPQHLHRAAQALPGRERGGAVERAAVPHRRDQLRWPRHRRQGPPLPHDHHEHLHLPRDPHQGLQVLQERRVLRPQLGQHRRLQRVHQGAAHQPEPRGVWPPRQRRHHLGPERDVRHARRAHRPAAAHGGGGGTVAGRGHLGDGQRPSLPHLVRVRPRRRMRQVPDRLQGVDEHRGDAGGAALQPPPEEDQLDAAGPAQGHQGRRRHVRGARGGRQCPLRQLCPRLVGRRRLPLPQAPRLMGQRPGAAHPLCPGLARRRSPRGILDLWLLLPAGVPHRRAAELRPRQPLRHRHHPVRLHRARRGDGGGRTTPRDRRAHPRTVPGRDKVGPRLAPPRRP